MNHKLTEIYRSCRPKEALASQDEYNSANALLGSEVEKFAQVIIKRCMDIAGDTAMGEPTYGWMVANNIKEHFGVEE